MREASNDSANARKKPRSPSRIFDAPVKLADPADGRDACSGTPFGSNSDVGAGDKCLFLAPAEPAVRAVVERIAGGQDRAAAPQAPPAADAHASHGAVSGGAHP